MNDAAQQAAEISARLDAYTHNATDPFLSAKQPIEFGFMADKVDQYQRRYHGFFVRDYRGSAIVAVTPQTRAEIAARNHSETQSLDQAARERILALPIRADGLILLDELATVALKNLPLDS